MYSLPRPRYSLCMPRNSSDSDQEDAPQSRRFSPGRLVFGGFLVAFAGAIAYSPILWANWQVAQGVNYQGAWTTVAVLGIFVWGIAAVVATVGLVVALKRPAPKQ